MSEMDRRLRAASQRHKAHDRKEASRQGLLQQVRRRFMTSLIGSLSSVEDHLGEIWGHGEAPDEIQAEWVEDWNRCRQEILDKGNAQLRALESELMRYEVELTGYSYQFEVRDGQ